MARSQSLYSRTFSTYNCSTRPTYSHAMAAKQSAAVDTGAITGNILVIRGHRVLLDSDLASLYQVATKALTRAVRRNAKRFPEDFMFRLAAEESGSLRSQSGAFKTGRGKHRKYAPYAFTEQGVAMLSSVLNSDRAVQGKHRDHAGLCSIARFRFQAQRLSRQIIGTGESIRPPVQGSL